VKPIIIFGGTMWNLPNDDNLKITYLAGSETEQEMKLFLPQDTHSQLAEKLNNMMSVNLPAGADLSRIALTACEISAYLEEYLNNYDHVLLFKRNLKETVLNKKRLLSNKDQALFQALLKQLDEPGDVFGSIETILTQVPKDNQQTVFYTSLKASYNIIAQYYVFRKVFADLKQEQDKMRAEASANNTHAMDYFRKKEYPLAQQFFQDAINLYTYCCLPDDPILARTYYNLGLTLFHLDKFAEAKTMLTMSLNLRKEILKLGSEDMTVKNTVLALDNCNKKLSSSANNLTMKK
jgi:tetratricopeptide (TPR) repeat protein